MSGVAIEMVYSSIVPIERSWPSVRVPRWWWPVRCPECGSSGPFFALAKWAALVVDDRLEVLDVTDEEVYLADDGPGLQCSSCSADFYPAPSMYALEAALKVKR